MNKRKEENEGKMKKIMLGFVGMILATFVMLLPTNKQGAIALTPVTPLAVNSPNEIASNLHENNGFWFYIPSSQHENFDYYSFTISERGWVVLWFSSDNNNKSEDYYDDLNNGCAISSDVSFKSMIKYKRAEYEGGIIRKYYLEPGKYYIRAKTMMGTWGDWYRAYNCFGYYIANSKFFSTTLTDKNCNEKTLSLNNKIAFSNSVLVNGILPLSDVNRDDMDTTEKTSYSITQNGEYTIFVENYSDEWKDYNFMQSFAVTDLGKHPNSTEKIEKASFTKDGKKVRTCNKCHKVVSSTVIPRIGKIEFNTDGCIYTGKNLKPKAYVYNRYGRKVSSDYYSVSYSNNKNIGKAKATIKLNGKYYSGKKETSFDIIPKGTSVKSLKAGKNKLVVSWKKMSGITGYEIRVSTSSSFPSSNTKVVTLKGASRDAASIKGLQSRRTYYVKVRTYKTVNGKNYYSKGSTLKTVKVQ